MALRCVLPSVGDSHVLTISVCYRHFTARTRNRGLAFDQPRLATGAAGEWRMVAASKHVASVLQPLIFF